jgi:DNA mismatch repair protein MutL
LQAILTVFGTASGEDLIEVNASREGPGAMRIEAWVSDPNHSMKTRRGQVFFVNGRYVKDEGIAGAVSEAYREFMFEGRFPHAYIFLSIDPALTDVNVHPTKSEIKFADGEAVRIFVRESILSGLMSASGIPKAHTARQFAAVKRAEHEYYRYKAEDDSDPPGLVSLRESNGEGASHATGPSEAPKEAWIKGMHQIGGEDARQGINQRSPDGAKSSDVSGVDEIPTVKLADLWGGGDGEISLPGTQGERRGFDASEEMYLPDAAGRGETRANMIGEPVAPGDIYSVQQEFRIGFLHVLGDVFGSYIVAADDDSLYLIDWHAAHERVNYERFMTEYRTGETLSQEMLTPQVLRLPTAAKLRAEEWAAWLTNAGFSAELFGDASLIVKSAPAFLSIGEAMRYAADLIEEGGKAPPDNDKAVARLISRACRSSVKANSSIKREEADALLRSLSACANPYTCPHGRPVFLRYTRRQLEKLFKRA